MEQIWGDIGPARRHLVVGGARADSNPVAISLVEDDLCVDPLYNAWFKRAYKVCLTGSEREVQIILAQMPEGLELNSWVSISAPYEGILNCNGKANLLIALLNAKASEGVIMILLCNGARLLDFPDKRNPIYLLMASASIELMELLVDKGVMSSGVARKALWSFMINGRPDYAEFIYSKREDVKPYFDNLIGVSLRDCMISKNAAINIMPQLFSYYLFCRNPFLPELMIAAYKSGGIAYLNACAQLGANMDPVWELVNSTVKSAGVDVKCDCEFGYALQIIDTLREGAKNALFLVEDGIDDESQGVIALFRPYVEKLAPEYRSVADEYIKARVAEESKAIEIVDRTPRINKRVAAKILAAGDDFGFDEEVDFMRAAHNSDSIVEQLLLKPGEVVQGCKVVLHAAKKGVTMGGKRRVRVGRVGR